ncbi:mediator of RNA polymerase II transcription subunit 1 [Ascaphus truei]|uniref:mediator of RNA polymerase II transcription subunit 1 n=1 Tax=Ascaphus truei TaxID=8439 RepID=UPI003F5A659C
MTSRASAAAAVRDDVRRQPGSAAAARVLGAGTLHPRHDESPPGAAPRQVQPEPAMARNHQASEADHGETRRYDVWRPPAPGHLLETLQKALKMSSLSAMTDRLESIARQNGLGSHLSPSGTDCYITSDMFYVEVQLDPAGLLSDVKVAHHGEPPMLCPELVQQLR